jgi:predicted RNA-binding protein with PUA-like domain
MAYWLFKSDPAKLSFSDLADEGYQGFEWSGVRDEKCFDHFAAMQPKDLAFFFHTGDENRFFGIVRILSTAKSDSTDDSGQWLSVDVAVFLRLINQVSLLQIGSDQRLAEFVSQVESGSSIQSVSHEQWAAVCELADMPKIPQSG